MKRNDCLTEFSLVQEGRRGQVRLPDLRPLVLAADVGRPAGLAALEEIGGVLEIGTAAGEDATVVNKQTNKNRIIVCLFVVTYL